MKIKPSFYLWRHVFIRIFITLCISISVFYLFPANASILIWPTNLQITHKEKATILWLENKGQHAKIMQVRVFKWVQHNHQDLLQNQNKVVVSPPITRIDPGQKQMIRVIHREPLVVGKEMTYRVIVDELPVLKNEKIVTSGIRVLLRYSVPVFLYGAGLEPDTLKKAGEKLSWRVVHDTTNHSWLEVKNTGLVHAHLNKFDLFLSSPSNIKPLEFSGYVLAGSSMRWLLPNHVDKKIEKITVTMNDQNAVTLTPIK